METISDWTPVAVYMAGFMLTFAICTIYNFSMRVQTLQLDIVAMLMICMLWPIVAPLFILTPVVTFMYMGLVRITDRAMHLLSKLIKNK